MFGIFETNRRSTGSRHCGKEEDAMLGYNNISTSDVALKQRHRTAEMAQRSAKTVTATATEKIITNTVVKYRQQHGFLLKTKNDRF